MENPDICDRLVRNSERETAPHHSEFARELRVCCYRSRLRLLVTAVGTPEKGRVLPPHEV